MFNLIQMVEEETKCSSDQVRECFSECNEYLPFGRKVLYQTLEDCFTQ